MSPLYFDGISAQWESGLVADSLTFALPDFPVVQQWGEALSAHPSAPNGLCRLRVSQKH